MEEKINAGDKTKLLEYLKKKIEEMPDFERTKIFGGIFTRIISTLAKRLIKHEGYAATNTILKRELNEIGRKDAKLISGIFGIKDRGPENSSQILKIAALILGFRLDVKDGETIVKECPFAVLAKEMKEPMLCSICSDYCQGITNEIVGENAQIEGRHDIEKEKPECYFKLKMRNE